MTRLFRAVPEGPNGEREWEEMKGVDAMSMTAVRRLQFCAGHRVFRHESKCSNIHGHNYVVFLHARAAQLDSVGRVIDFGVLKAKFLPWIEEQWDHGMLLNGEDPLVPLWPSGHKLFTAGFNPTAENMAAYLLHHVAPMLLKGTFVEVWKVTLWETENCYAEVTL